MFQKFSLKYRDVYMQENKIQSLESQISYKKRKKKVRKGTITFSI